MKRPSKIGKADMAVSLIAKLYAIEKTIKEADAKTRHQIRQTQAVPQLQKIRTWLDKTLHSTLPKGLLGKAVSYLDKNWLFSASVNGVKASANIYSLIETAKTNHQEPYQYLRHLFTELPKVTTASKIDVLLPWNVDLQGGVC
jgi:hypothetical protein